MDARSPQHTATEKAEARRGGWGFFRARLCGQARILDREN